MNREHLSTVLSRAATAARPFTMPNGIRLSPSMDTVTWFTPQAEESVLIAALEREAELEEFRSSWQFLAANAHEVNLKALARWLVVRARETNPEQALQELERYLAASNIS